MGKSFLSTIQGTVENNQITLKEKTNAFKAKSALGKEKIEFTSESYAGETTLSFKDKAIYTKAQEVVDKVIDKTKEI